jgi:hypothetical protein
MAVKKTEKTRTHFTFRIDTWTADGESIVEHLAGVEDYTLAMATYRSCDRTLAQHTDHVAAGRPRDRGQPAPTSGVTKAGRPGVKPRSGLPSAQKVVRARRDPVFFGRSAINRCEPDSCFCTDVLIFGRSVFASISSFSFMGLLKPTYTHRLQVLGPEHASLQVV